MEASQEQARRPRPRIESLSDLIFGLALSIGAFTLVSNPPTTVLGIYTDVGTFGFNFVVLISAWMKYTRIMSVLPLETGRTTMLNILLLFAVSIEPFLFNVLRLGTASLAFQDTATALYGLDIGVLLCILGVFTVTLADEERRLVPKDMVAQLRAEAVSTLVGGAIFLVSALPVFGAAALGGESIRIDMWLIAVAISWIRRLSRKASASRSGSSQ